ncbi:MAG TPA: hypothetical protein VG847_01615 [Chitinophagaceae bacterium]|nr:hypothetical protein [Chitinophagaceae bacterium]
MKFRILILTLLLACGSSLNAQYYFYNGDYYENDVVFEIGGSIGGMNCFTDLGGRKGIGKKFVKDFNLKTTQMSGGMFFSVVYKNEFALRLEATFGNVEAYDSILASVKDKSQERYYRNLSFRSPISEIALVAEFHPFYIFGDYDEDHTPPAVSPYLVAGIGYFHFNPEAKLGNNWVNLQPLHTEGEGFAEYPNVKNYKLSQINFPIGIGARYDVSPIINLRAEILTRFLQTDYLDDVSGRYIDPAVFSKYLSGQDLANALLLNDRAKPGAETAHPNGIRGNPKNNDSYITFNIKLGLTLGRERTH